MKLFFVALILMWGSAYADGHLSPGDRDGQVHNLNGGKFVAWDAVNEQWLGPEDFWRSFAERKRGRVWPSSKEFPPYADVSEHDTFLYLVESGPCLMYFFHRRWRRANDVWRWGEEFNQYGGCPRVFD